VAEKAERMHQAKLAKLKKEEEEHEEQVREEAVLKKQKHDDIVANAIAKAKEMKPILDK
jgi:hypothetical protein